MNHDLNERYVLTELGMRSLAVRAGVPPDTFARHGGVTVADAAESDGPARTIRHREHTIGVNRFFAQLAADARHAGWRLDEWRNEAESTHRFSDDHGGTRWVRPDGSGVLLRGAEVRSFLLEYDRGTLDAGDYLPKFEAYRRYYSGRQWEGHFTSEPMLLFVCSDARAEQRVAAAARTLASNILLLIISEGRAATRAGNPDGLLGPVWRTAGADGGMRRCLEPGTDGTRDG